MWILSVLWVGISKIVLYVLVSFMVIRPGSPSTPIIHVTSILWSYFYSWILSSVRHWAMSIIEAKFSHYSSYLKQNCLSCIFLRVSKEGELRIAAKTSTQWRSDMSPPFISNSSRLCCLSLLRFSRTYASAYSLTGATSSSFFSSSTAGCACAATAYAGYYAAVID